MIGGGVFTFLSLVPSFVISLVAALTPTSLVAQGRSVTTHAASDPEGRLIAYYSSAMLFSSLGAHAPAARWSVALEGTWIPALSESERRPGIDKPETTNLAPLLPRPRLVLRTRFATLEGSWIPPVRVGDARADLRAVAISRTVARWRGLHVIPRVSVVAGRVRGAITCNAETAAAGGRDLATYYAAVCHGRDSDDWFEPRIAAGEVVVDRPWRAARPDGRRLWLAVGGRVDRSRFDIGVRHADGARDQDHPVLRLHDARPHLAAGIRAPIARRTDGALEWFYAPGSMATLRAMVTVRPGTR